jgi:hypothetical protein
MTGGRGGMMIGGLGAGAAVTAGMTGGFDTGTGAGLETSAEVVGLGPIFSLSSSGLKKQTTNRE